MIMLPEWRGSLDTWRVCEFSGDRAFAGKTTSPPSKARARASTRRWMPTGKSPASASRFTTLTVTLLPTAP